MDCTEEEEKRAILITIKVRLDLVNILIRFKDELHMTYDQIYDFLIFNKSDLETKFEQIQNGKWEDVKHSLSNRIDSAKEEIPKIKKKHWWNKK